MAHSDVAINTHHGEGEDTGEHVVVVDGKDELAQDFPKWPGVHKIFGALEGERAGSQGVGKSQIEDVDVCSSLHLGVSGERRECFIKAMPSGKGHWILNVIFSMILQLILEVMSLKLIIHCCKHNSQLELFFFFLRVI